MDIREIQNKDLTPISKSLEGTSAATATNYSVFFIASYPGEIIRVVEAHTTVGSDGSAVELNIEKLGSGVALDSGVEVLITDFSLKSTINTPVEKKGTDLQNTKFEAGDRFALKDTGTLTAVAGVCVTMYIKYLGKGHYQV